MEEKILYKAERHILYIRSIGYVTAALCPTLKNKVYKQIDNDPQLTNIKIDLNPCNYMDSTFMGLLIGIHKYFIKRRGKNIEILNPSHACYHLLKGLGIENILPITYDGDPFPGDMKQITKEENSNAEFILNTHENLMQASPENRKKFAVLHEVLKKQIKKNGSE